MSQEIAMRSYRALLHGDRLEWLEEAPEPQKDVPLQVYVMVLEQARPVETGARGCAMAAILEKLAKRGAFSAIADPANWQRTLRRDRALPEREE